MGLKISYVFMRFPEPSQTFAVSDVTALQKQGHDVSIWCLRNPHPEFSDQCETLGVDPDRVIQPRGYRQRLGLNAGDVSRRKSVRWELINLIRRHCWNQPKVLAKSLALVGNADRLSARLIESSPDVVHCFWGHYPALVALAVKLRSPATPVTMFLGAYDLETRHPLTRLAASRVDWLFTHAQANLLKIRELGVDTSRFTVVHRGIPIDDFGEPAAELPRANRILTVGAAFESKGHQTVIRAVDHLADRWPDLNCDVVGDGPYLSRLQSLAKSSAARTRIHFHGHLPRQAVMQKMRESALLVNASIKPSERLPNVIKEAMWAGCGVVAGRTPGIDELLPPKLGEVVPTDNYQAYAAAIDGELSKGIDPGQVAARRDWIRSNFTAEASMQRYVDRWVELLGQPRFATTQPLKSTS